MILRNEGIDYYNQWVAHEMPFNDPPVVDAMQQVADLWATRGHGVRRRWLDRRHAVRRQRPGARRRPVHDAPPGQLLRLVLPGGHGVRRRPRAPSTRSTSRRTRVRRSSWPAPARRRSGTRPRCGPSWTTTARRTTPTTARSPSSPAWAPSRAATSSPASCRPTRTPTRPTTARSSRASSKSWRPANRPASTPPTRCRPRSGRARSGGRPRPSSTARRIAQAAADAIESVLAELTELTQSSRRRWCRWPRTPVTGTGSSCPR